MPVPVTPGKPRLLIIGAYGMTNLGDDAILAAMLAELREALPGATFAVVAQDLAALPVAVDITPVPFTDLAIREALDGADLLIIGGGGLLFDFRIRASYDSTSGEGPREAGIVRAGVRVRLEFVGVRHCARSGTETKPVGKEIRLRLFAQSP